MSEQAQFPRPGVGVVVRKRDAEGMRILLIKRGKPPRAGTWSIPGGRQELGETIRDAARREVKEETGLEVEIAELLDVLDSITGQSRGGIAYHYTLIDFAADWVSGDPIPGSDAIDAVWADPDDLNRFELWDQTRRIIAMAVS